MVQRDRVGMGESCQPLLKPESSYHETGCRQCLHGENRQQIQGSPQVLCRHKVEIHTECGMEGKRMVGLHVPCADWVV